MPGSRYASDDAQFAARTDDALRLQEDAGRVACDGRTDRCSFYGVLWGAVPAVFPIGSVERGLPGPFSALGRHETAD